MSREVASRALIHKHDAVHALIMILAAPDIQVKPSGEGATDAA